VIGATALPLLVALVSVTIAAVPIVADALTPKASIISAAFQAASGNYLSALVSNAGGRPGSISAAFLTIPDDDKKGGDWIYALTVVTPDSAGAVVAPAQSSVLVRFAARKGMPPNYFLGKDIQKIATDDDAEHIEALTLGDARCGLRYFYSNFDGSHSTTEQTIGCSDLVEFVLGAEHALDDNDRKAPADRNQPPPAEKHH